MVNAEQFFDLERMIRYLRDLERRVERLEMDVDRLEKLETERPEK